MRLQHWLANRLILRPSRHAIEASGLQACAIPLAATGVVPAGTLECFAARQCPGSELPRGDSRAEGSRAFPVESSEPPELLILKLPGTAGRAERSTLFPASLLGHRTAEVWTCNPPGYGRSTGRASLAAVAAAAVHFFDWVAARRRDQRTVVWLCGNSLGSATALHVAASRRVDGLVLRNPPPLVDLVRLRGGWWNLVGGGNWVASGIPHEMDAVATATGVFAPIVFIESGADTLVPPSLQQHIRDAHPGPQRTVQLAGAEHDTPLSEADRPAIREAVGWLWEQQGEGNSGAK
ncbi:alpha/beta hydrolase [Candidatus Laterigemmans baculatus]|uniref:alpha/beta hydrolase n=1 Tax=Candidatus Laterigemmans baculatus TaxID=2770505 RepID=UPI0013DA79B3|nr:alpha/beta hydrolase [Candidatus Laterigemmans baculatus]